MKRILTSITIRNKIMMKLYTDQAYMLITKTVDPEKEELMTSGETEKTFTIK